MTRCVVMAILLFSFFSVLGQTTLPSEAEVRFYEQVIATRDEARTICIEIAAMVRSNLDLYTTLDKKVHHPDDKKAVALGIRYLNEASAIAAPICEAFNLLDDDRAADITKKDFPRFQKERMPTDTRSFYINLYKLALFDLRDTILWWNRAMETMRREMKKKPRELVIKELLTAIIQDAEIMRMRLETIRRRYPLDGNLEKQ